MTLTVFPVDAVTGAPAYSGRMTRQALSLLASGATAARPLGGHSGIRSGSGVVVTASSTVWTVKPHSGQVDLEAAAEASIYLYANDANVTGAVTAAHATLARVDIVYAKLSDPAEADGSATPKVEFLYLAGTASGSPVAPATPARSVVLATLAVPASGGGSPTVTMACLEVGGGVPIGVRSTTQRDALTPFNGMLVRRLDTNGSLERHNGTNWVGTTAVKYTSVGGAAPATTISAAGTILETLIIPDVGYARTLDVAMSGFIATTSSADVWEFVGTFDSSNITINVCGRLRCASPTANASGTFNCLVDQAAGASSTLRVWVRRISGSGTGAGSADETYTRIDCVAHPV